MTKTKKRQILIMTVVTLVICTFLLWNTLDKQEYKGLNSNNNTAASSNAIVITKDDVNEFIDTYNLYELTLYSNNYEELTNQNKLVLITNYLIKQGTVDYKEGVDKAHYETYIHYVFGVDSQIENENINYNGITIEYDETDEKYYYNGELSYIEPEIVLNKLTNYENKELDYSLSTKTVYESNNKIYGSIKDLTNNQNVLYENIKTKNFENKYYPEIEEKVEEVNYSFRLEGTHLVLKDYNVVIEEK